MHAYQAAHTHLPSQVLYPEVCSRIRRRVPNVWHWISGGRGLGKTALLRDASGIIEKPADDLPSRAVVPLGHGRWLVHGFHVEVARKELLNILERPTDCDIFIDDFLQVLNDDIARALVGAYSRSTVSCKIVVTARLPMDIASNVVLTHHWSGYSPFNLFSERYGLNPWEAKWEERIRTMVQSAGATKSAEMWSGLLIAVTGGHPSLLGPGLVEVRKLIGANSALTEDTLSTFSRHFEDYLAVTNSVDKVSRGIDALKQEDPECFQILRRIAAGTRELGAATLKQRRRLYVEGLIHEDKNRQLVVPGKIIRETILSAAVTPPESHVLKRVDFEPWGGEKGGGVVRGFDEAGIEMFALDLVGEEWRFLMEVSAARGEPVSLEALAGPEREVEQLRSTQARLARKLRKVGGDGLIENVHGKGYRIAHGVIVQDGETLPAAGRRPAPPTQKAPSPKRSVKPRQT